MKVDFNSLFTISHSLVPSYLPMRVVEKVHVHVGVFIGVYVQCVFYIFKGTVCRGGCSDIPDDSTWQTRSVYSVDWRWLVRHFKLHTQIQCCWTV